MPKRVNCFLEIVDNRRGRASNRHADDVAATAAPHPTITLLQTSSLTSVVQSELERMILSGELAPGAKLTEVALAARLGVSRGPLREAFRMLEEAGLVRTEKNRGVFVRDIPIEEAIEIFDLRAAMDELVGRRLAETITPAQLKEVRGLVEQMEQARQGQGRARATTCSTCEFHDRAGRARRQRQADRDLPQADQGAEPVPPPQPGRRLADADLGRRAPRRSSRRSPRATPRPPAGRCSTTCIESKERTIKNHQREPAPSQIAGARAAAPPRASR